MKVFKTDQYDKWFRKLQDPTAKARINARIRRIGLAGRLIGDWKTVGGKVVELRMDYGPGYRIYSYVNGSEFILLLFGGGKSRQQADIEKSKAILREWEAQGGCRG